MKVIEVVTWFDLSKFDVEFSGRVVAPSMPLVSAILKHETVVTYIPEASLPFFVRRIAVLSCESLF